ncbi:MAG: hypothetical protein ACYDCC_13780 [Actinomycetota bacterium]
MPERVALLVDEDETHWTVVLDKALKQGLVKPTPNAKSEVLHALKEAEHLGLICKASTGTYRRIT